MKIPTKPPHRNLPVILSITVPAFIAILAVPVIISFSIGAPVGTEEPDPVSLAVSDAQVPATGIPSIETEPVASCTDRFPSSANDSLYLSAITDSGSFSSPDGSTGEYIKVAIEPARNRDTILRTSAYFKAAIPDLESALSGSSRFSRTILLDADTQTSAYILAKDNNYAANLNGYFYYLIDASASAEMVSPAVLSISALFEEDSRAECTSNGTFAQADILDTLEASLKAVLGKYYSDEIFEFIRNRYRDAFSKRYKGEKVSAEAVKLVLPGIDIIYRDSFMTYVEFYITK